MESTELKKPQNQELNNIKVLIADDDLPTRILLKAAIAKWGYEIYEAQDGEEAWKILEEKFTPDLIILDWIMPKIDGVELCTRIRKELSHQPYIILLTQMTGTTNIIKGLEAGADEFLSKPFNMGELRSRISVGVRITTNEIKLKKQNRQLIDFKKQVEEILENLTETNIQNIDPDRIQKLEGNLKKLIDLL